VGVGAVIDPPEFQAVRLCFSLQFYGYVDVVINPLWDIEY